MNLFGRRCPGGNRDRQKFEKLNKKIPMKKLIVALSGLVLVGVWQAPGAEKVDFAKQVVPILKDRCYECHGPKKDKGDLRLDTKEGMFAEDYVVIPGKPEESEMIVRVTLAPDHDDIMPPKGDPLTTQQVDILKNWIKGGAVWPEGVQTVMKEKKQDGPLDKLGAVKPSAEEAKAIEELEKLGVSVRPVAKDLVWKTANLRSLDIADAKKALPHLAKVTTLTDLNLASRELTDAELKHIAPLKNLTRLHLENNKITDAGLDHLKGMGNLHYLNLYGTEVSDGGIVKLKGMSHLAKVYLWQTKVTDKGVAALKKDRPKIEVVRGWEPAAVVAKKEDKKAEEKKDDKKAETKKPAEKKDDKKKPADKKDKKAEPKKAEDKKPAEKKDEKKAEEKKDEDKKPEPKKDDKKE